VASKCGTPQGDVASPLLANIYMNRFLKYWRLSGCGEAFRAHVVSYADDFVILSCGRAAEALAWTKAVMTKLGLTINEAKTSLKDARDPPDPGAVLRPMMPWASAPIRPVKMTSIGVFKPWAMMIGLSTLFSTPTGAR